MAQRVRDGESLSRPEVALLAGFAVGSSLKVENMEQTIKVQDEMITELRRTVSLLREPHMNELARLGQLQGFDPEDREDHE